MSSHTPQHDDADDDAAGRRLRRIFVRVMIVQIVTLALLGWLQVRFGR